MMNLPVRITAVWVSSLGDGELVEAESQLRQAFSAEETEQKRLAGAKYELMKGPAVLLDAWQRWSVVNNATRARGLHPRSYR